MSLYTTKKPQDLAPLVAQLLKIPQETVDRVIEAHYKTLKEDILSLDYSSLTFEYFGKLRASPTRIKNYIHRLIVKYRENPTPELKEKIHKLYLLYKQAHVVSLNRKFKKRFKTWHNTYKDGRSKTGTTPETLTVGDQLT